MAESADLGTRTYAAISQRSLNTEPSSWTAAVGWFVKAAGGSVSAAARLAGVPRKTFADWVQKGARPKGPRQEDIIRSAQLSERRARLRPGRERRLRNGAVGSLTIKAVYNYDGGKPRTVNIGNYMDEFAVDELIDAFLAGADEEQLREVFADNITLDPSGFYQRTLALGPHDEHGWTVSAVTL